MFGIEERAYRGAFNRDVELRAQASNLRLRLVLKIVLRMVEDVHGEEMTRVLSKSHLSLLDSTQGLASSRTTSLPIKSFLQLRSSIHHDGCGSHFLHRACDGIRKPPYFAPSLAEATSKTRCFLFWLVLRDAPLHPLAIA